MREYFRNVGKAARFVNTAPDGVFGGIETLEMLSEAMILDKLNPDLGIKGVYEIISKKFISFINKKHYKFNSLLRAYKFVEAHEILTEMEGYIERAPDASELRDVKAIQGNFMILLRYLSKK